MQTEGVIGLTVLDGDRGVKSNDDSWDFMPLADGAVIDLDNLGDLTEEDARGVHWGTARINIRATTVGDVGSVVFDYDDGEFTSTVRVSTNPYETLMWENDFVFTNGYHTLKVTAWGGFNGNGMELSHIDVGFTIVSAVTEGAENVPEVGGFAVCCVQYSVRSYPNLLWSSGSSPPTGSLLRTTQF